MEVFYFRSRNANMYNSWKLFTLSQQAIFPLSLCHFDFTPRQCCRMLSHFFVDIVVLKYIINAISTQKDVEYLIELISHLVSSFRFDKDEAKALVIVS